MKKILLFLVLTILSCKGAFSQVNPQSIFERNIFVIEEFFTGKPMYGNKVDDAVKFLEDLTGIKSDVDLAFDVMVAPSQQNLKDWKAWYDKNKDNLYWDDNEKKVKVRK